MSNWVSITEAIEEIKQGRFVVVVDDEQRENEGDLVLAAEKTTPQAVNFMIQEGRGLVCAPCEVAILKRLGLKQMVEESSDQQKTQFTVSIDASSSRTGISSFERAQTLRLLADRNSQASDFVKPGHIFPIGAAPLGVLERKGHTEAAVELAKLAGFSGVGVICEIIKADGRMARKKDLEVFAKKHSLKMISISSLVEYQLARGAQLRLQAATDLPTKQGEFYLLVFENLVEKKEHLVLLKNRRRKKISAETNSKLLQLLREDFFQMQSRESVLTRLHSECFTGDALHSLRCDCGEQLEAALKKINEEGEGLLIYLRQEGRGIGLVEKLKAYNLQNEGLDTYEANLELGHSADSRNYFEAVSILKQLGVRSVQLLTNNPEKVKQLETNGVKVTRRLPLVISPQERNKNYLQTKKKKFGHFL